MPRLSATTCILLCFTALSACSAIGPESIRANRADYNQAIQQTNDQELLLNIVRIRYRDTLYFTTVERIAATQQLEKSLGVNAGATFSQNRELPLPFVNGTIPGLTVGQSISVPASVSVTENPTVFYAPIEGQKFVQQMMMPMSPETLELLVRSGWSLDRVFTVAVQEMNGLENAPTATGPTPSYEPEFQPFREAVHLMRKLQREHNLVLAQSAGKKTVEFRILHGQANSETAMRLKEMLHLNPSIDHITLMSGEENQNDHTLAITTRPLMAALNYVSQGVEPPQRDIEAGRVRPTVHSDGKTPFDWQEMLAGIFRVKSSPTPPANASVAINYRNAWFYIEDNDLDSKSTFVLLTELIALHSVPPSSGGPVLAVNVGGG